MSEQRDEKYDVISKELNKRVIDNINALLKYRKISVNRFVNEMEKQKACLTRVYTNTLLHNPKNSYLPFAFVMLCCDFFGVTVENLISDQFDPSQYENNGSEIHQEYINIVNVLNRNKDHTETKKEKVQNRFYTPGNWPDDEKILITDPNNILFKGYLQDYYCYYYPTSSSENKSGTKIIRGILSLENDGSYCKAVLRINTSGAPGVYAEFDKEYVGYAVISVAVGSLYCIMYSKDMGEFCFLMLRYFKLNSKPLYCRIAQVMSSCSGTEERRPTVLRMFLSNEVIKEEDLHLIAPSILLNYSDIPISVEALSSLAEENEDYDAIVKELWKTHEGVNMLFLDEQDDVMNVAVRILKSKVAAKEFAMQLRALSYSFRYNKISYKADKNVMDVLAHHGYY